MLKLIVAVASIRSYTVSVLPKVVRAYSPEKVQVLGPLKVPDSHFWATVVSRMWGLACTYTCSYKYLLVHAWELQSDCCSIVPKSATLEYNYIDSWSYQLLKRGAASQCHAPACTCRYMYCSCWELTSTAWSVISLAGRPITVGTSLLTVLNIHVHCK